MPLGRFLIRLYLAPMLLKKRLKVMSLAFLPEAFFQASRAFDTL